MAFKTILLKKGDEASPLLERFAMDGIASFVHFCEAHNLFNENNPLITECMTIPYGFHDDAIYQYERFHITVNFRLQYIGVERFIFNHELAKEL